MTVLNEDKSKLVEENLFLVKNIVKNTISINENIQGLGYEDLYQTGCIALCHAALKYNASRGAAFPTFASTVIKNELISHCRRILRIQNPILYLDNPISEGSDITFADTLPDHNFHALTDVETFCLLADAEKQLSGISKKGIAALRMKYMGLNCKEIALFYNVRPNVVTAWMARAVQKLRLNFYLDCIYN